MEEILHERLNDLQSKNLYRQIDFYERSEGAVIHKNGHEYISFSCNDYFGLSQDKRVKLAAKEAIGKFGVGAGASRLVTGSSGFYQELEEKIASLKKTDEAIVFGSGYLANIGTILALVGKGDLILADKLSHACIIDGAKLSSAGFKRFAHNDMEHLTDLLKKYREQYQSCLIITETVFSMDGDRASLDKLYKLAQKYRCTLLSDDAHGLFDRDYQSHIKMGTLSKALGCYGGYIAADKVTIDYIKNAARSLIFSTALPPSVVASANAAIDIVSSGGMAAEVFDKVVLFCDMLGLDKPQSAIVPVIVGDEKKAMDISSQLENEGFIVPAIRPPTVPEGTTRLRFTFSASHRKQDVKKLANLVKNLL